MAQATEAVTRARVSSRNSITWARLTEGKSSRKSSIVSPASRWAASVARAEAVSFLDLNERVARRYEALGQAAVALFFADEHTHTNKAGADLNADVVVEGLRALPANPLGRFLAEP